MDHRKRVTPFSIGSEILLVVFCLFILTPFLWMLSTALRSPVTAFRLPPAILPTVFDISNFRLVFEKVDFLGFGKNSLKVAGLVTIGQLVVCSLAAYAFARLKFPGKQIIFMMFLAALMLPAQVISIPQFIFMSRLRLVNSHAALILPMLFSAMSIFLIRQNMLSIPMSFNEAAKIDGAGDFRIYSSIIIPMAKPSLVVAGTLTFIAQWNDFHRPLIFINTERLMTMPLGLVALRGRLNSGSQAGVIAGVLLATLAPLLFYIFGQKYLIEGATLGGLKG